MKKGLVFVISLLANAALGLVVVTLVGNRPAAKTGGPEPAATNRLAAASPETPEPPTKSTQTQAVMKKFDWRMVESADYKKYIANLRSIGCPEETIRDIILADVNKLFESRRKEATASTNKFQYWKTGDPYVSALDPDWMEKLQALNKEKRELLKELLGVAPVEPVDFFANVNPFESMLDFLTPEKQSQIVDLRQKYQARIMKLVSNGQPDAEGMKKIQQLRKDMDAELQGMLFPEEYRQYQLRTSDTAMSMRYQLAGFDPSQDEFDRIFNLRKKFDDQFPMRGMGPPGEADQDKVRTAREALNAQIKTMLGDARYAEYERSQDFSFQSIYRVTDKYGLSKEVAFKVYDVQKAAEDEAQKIRNDSSLTPDQRDTALSGIRNQTETALPQMLGDKAWPTYKRQAKWLDGISTAQAAAPR